MVKLGLNDSYDRTIIPNKIRAYGDITKPASSIGIMAAIPFATILYAHLVGYDGVEFMLDNITTVIYAAVTLFFVHGGSQAMNMAEDAYMDKQASNKQNRPIPAGIISEDEARSLAWVFIMFGIMRAFTITPQFGYIIAVLAMFGVFYNLDPVRAKKHLWFNLIWQATSRGLLLYPATFAIWGDVWNPVAWAMGVIAFLLVLSLQNTADFADVHTDSQFGIITPAVYHGLDELTQIMFGIVCIMFALISAFIALNIIPNFWMLYLIAIPIGWSLWDLWNKPDSVADMSGNHITWYTFYASLAFLYILPAVQVITF